MRTGAMSRAARWLCPPAVEGQCARSLANATAETGTPQQSSADAMVMLHVTLSAHVAEITDAHVPRDGALAPEVQRGQSPLVMHPPSRGAASSAPWSAAAGSWEAPSAWPLVASMYSQAATWVSTHGGATPSSRQRGGDAAPLWDRGKRPRRHPPCSPPAARACCACGAARWKRVASRGSRLAADGSAWHADHSKPCGSRRPSPLPAARFEPRTARAARRHQAVRAGFALAAAAGATSRSAEAAPMSSSDVSPTASPASCSAGGCVYPSRDPLDGPAAPVPGSAGSATPPHPLPHRPAAPPARRAPRRKPGPPSVPAPRAGVRQCPRLPPGRPRRLPSRAPMPTRLAPRRLP